MIRWIKRLLWCTLFGRHNWWHQVIDGSGINYRTMRVVRTHYAFDVCVRCGLKRVERGRANN